MPAETINEVQFPKVMITGPSGFIADVDSTGHLLTTGGSSNVIDGVTVSGTPSLGQVLTATSPTTANWQAPAGATGWQFIQSTETSFTQGGFTIVSLPFTTPFADDNYTVQVTVVCEEAAPETPTVTQFPSAGVAYVTRLTPAGTGVEVCVSNHDSGAHTGIVNVTAYHA